jgi:hypothetical protein
VLIVISHMLLPLLVIPFTFILIPDVKMTDNITVNVLGGIDVNNDEDDDGVGGGTGGVGDPDDDVLLDVAAVGAGSDDVFDDDVPLISKAGESIP